MRPQLEHYARCTLSHCGFIIEPGIELHDGDDLDVLTGELEAFAKWIGLGMFAQPARDRLRVCREAAVESEKRWPGRAFFIEIHDAKCERWTQTYQPYGIPLTNR